MQVAVGDSQGLAQCTYPTFGDRWNFPILIAYKLTGCTVQAR